MNSHFSTWSEFFHMGGYALFVWLAFGVSLLALVLMVVDSILDKRRLVTEVNRESARQQRIQAAKVQALAAKEQDTASEISNES